MSPDDELFKITEKAFEVISNKILAGAKCVLLIPSHPVSGDDFGFFGNPHRS